MRWHGDACGTGAAAVLLMDQNKAIAAIFESIPNYRLIVTGGGRTISGNPASQYADGSIVIFLGCNNSPSCCD